MRKSASCDFRMPYMDCSAGAWLSQPAPSVMSALGQLNGQHVQVSGLFFAIGHEPASAFLAGQLQTDEDGYIVTKPGTTQTNREAVFACGDVQDKKWRQAITAAGTGAYAAQWSRSSLVGWFGLMLWQQSGFVDCSCREHLCTHALGLDVFKGNSKAVH